MQNFLLRKIKRSSYALPVMSLQLPHPYELLSAQVSEF
jgi:hypothetical protein